MGEIWEGLGETLTRNAAPNPMKRKPTANAGNGGAEAWRELPMATMNDAVGEMMVGQREWSNMVQDMSYQ